MTDALDGVRDHYRATGLTVRLKTALAVLGPEDDRFTRPSNSPPSDSPVELAIANDRARISKFKTAFS